MDNKKAKKRLYRATLASVVKEMALPRLAESVREEGKKNKPPRS
jgi:hypothetical protein